MLQLGTILEHLKAQRDKDVVVNPIDATVMTTAADITLVMMDPVNTVVQPVVVSQTPFPIGPSRLAAAYPWGMAHNYNPQFVTRNPFMPYQPFAAVSNGNYVAFSRGMPNHYST